MRCAKTNPQYFVILA